MVPPAPPLYNCKYVCLLSQWGERDGSEGAREREEGEMWSLESVREDRVSW